MGSTTRSKMLKGTEVLKAFLYLGRKKEYLDRVGLYPAPLILYNPASWCANLGLNFLNANDFQLESRV